MIIGLPLAPDERTSVNFRRVGGSDLRELAIRGNGRSARRGPRGSQSTLP